MSNRRQDNPKRREVRFYEPPKLCDGVPITHATNINRLVKGQRQERKKARGYALPHNRAGWIEFSKGVRWA